MTAPTHAVRHLVYARDGHRCVSCGTRYGLEIQHRQAVGMGGSKRKPGPEACVTSCGGPAGCNARYESDMQSKALQYGWKVRRNTLEPLTEIPVFYWLEQGWFLLDADGNRTPFRGDFNTERSD